MPPRLKDAFEREMASARSMESAGDCEAAWRALEKAHILSQRWTMAHLRVHAAMLGIAWRERDFREVSGQLLRMLFAAPGSLLDRAPLGNTGRSNVGIFAPMPIPPELQRLLDAIPERRRDASTADDRLRRDSL